MGDVVLKLLGQNGGEVLDGGVGIIHGSRCGIPNDLLPDNIPRRHQLKVHVIVCRGRKGPLNAEAESTFDMLGHPTAQRPQAAGHQATRQGTLPLELLAHGHDGLLQLCVLSLCRRKRGVDSFLHRGLVCHRLPQL